MGTKWVDSTLSTELACKTVTAPTVFTGQSPIPKAPLDKVFSLGYHYDPIDIAVNAYVLNGSLTLGAGTKVAVYGDRGFVVESGGVLSGEGTPTEPIKIFPYTAVQELSLNCNRPATPYGTAAGSGRFRGQTSWLG